jgi:hypothetical protein
MHKYLLFLVPLFLLFTSGAFGLETKENELIQSRIVDFNQRVPADHPRLMLKSAELQRFRDYINQMRAAKTYPELFDKIFPEPGNEPLPAEPPVPPDPKNSAASRQVWQNSYNTAFKAGNTAQRFAFAYLITGEERFGREAARWLLHVASWKITAGVSLKYNDEAFIQSLRPMLFAYDWAYGALTEAERRTVQKALALRLDQLYKQATSKFSLVNPTPADNSLSHPMRFISTMGIGGLVLYQDLPQAPTYLAWAYEYYLRQFPVWGGADGGWSEGLNYWNSGISQHMLFLEAMKALGLTEVLQKPFFKNNPYFAMYNIQPYSFSSFGDLCNIVAPNPNTALILEKYALFYQDPYLLAYFQTIFTKYPSGYEYYQFSAYDSIMQLYRKAQTPLIPGNLADLPRSRWNRDIGWVAFHSELGSKANDIMFALKSSPYGSASHSFSDQNSFVVNAFGEPLAISSGYREWYDSAHHVGWTRTTTSKNAVLFDGMGQILKDAKATGQITAFYTGWNYDFTGGDAVPAYGSTARQALRHVLFVNRRYFVVFDELASDLPVSHQWLLHAKEKMLLKPEENTITITKGKANLETRLLLPAPAELRFSQTDRFKVPVDPTFAAKMKNEWHVTADAFQAQNRREFLAWLLPFSTGLRPALQPELVKTTRGYAVLSKGITEDLILLARHDERSVTAEGVSFTGKAAVVSSQNGKPISFFILDGERLQTAGLQLEAISALTVEGAWLREGLKLNVVAKGPAELRLQLPTAPVRIEGIPKESWQYNPSGRWLILRLPGAAKLVVYY